MVKGQKIRAPREDLVFAAIVYALGMLVTIIVLYPLVYVVSASLSSPLELMANRVVLLPKSFQLNAYQAVFKNNDILTGYKNTILYAFAGTVLNLAMTIAAAYPLSRPDMAGRRFITLMVTFTMFFSGGMIPTFIIIRNLKLLNTFWVMILPGAISATNMVIMRNYFQHSIPGDIIEAAYMDGCSGIGTMIRVVLPLSLSIVAVIVIFYFVGHWNAYFDAFIYLTDASKYPLQVFLRQILIKNQFSGEESSTAEMALLYETLKFAVIIVSSLPVMLLYPFMQRYFVKGIMMGSLKG